MLLTHNNGEILILETSDNSFVTKHISVTALLVPKRTRRLTPKCVS